METPANSLPTLQTARLRLRPFTLADAGEVQRLAGDPRVSAYTLNIPHPYADGMAEAWIATHEPDLQERRGMVFAIETQADAGLIGAISLRTTFRHRRAELGYWIGVPYWGQGYCTEAAQALMTYAFESLGLHKITSRHLVENPASGRVMEKVGMEREGKLKDEFWKGDTPHAVVVYGLINPSVQPKEA